MDVVSISYDLAPLLAACSAVVEFAELAVDPDRDLDALHRARLDATLAVDQLPGLARYGPELLGSLEAVAGIFDDTDPERLLRAAVHRHREETRCPAA